MKIGARRNTNIRKKLIKKYQLKVKTIAEIVEMLKQSHQQLRKLKGMKLVASNSDKITCLIQIKGDSIKISRKARIIQQKYQVKKKLQSSENIWENPKDYNTKANWIESNKSVLNKHLMEDFEITTEMIKHQVKKIKNWTASRKDEVHGYWLKHLFSLRTRIAKQLHNLLKTGAIESWMTTGKTTFVMKNKEGKLPRPITCLPTIFKLMTAYIAESMINHFENNGLIPDL